MKGSASTEPVPRRRRLRGLLFRVAAVALGLAPFVLCEAVLTLFDVGRPTCGEDPFVGFSAVHPLFVLNEEATRYEIPRGRQEFFRAESFAAEKPADECRIFCLGGSTVQGRPFGIETSFTTWLEMDLRAADPTRRWEVVNCGGVSYASYRLVPILEEVLGHQADMIILYAGHNEFLEDRTYRHLKHLPQVVARPAATLSHTRTCTLLRRAYVRMTGRPGDAALEGRPVLEADTDAMLEYRGGLAKYHRDEKWRRDVIHHFRFNLRRMVQICREADVPLLLVNPVCNLRDCPPFKTQHCDGLTDEELRQWKQLCDRAGECYGKDPRQAVALLQEAAAIDDRHAGMHYLLAKCYDALGQTAEARESYVRAKEEDICPLRILEPMHRAILEVAAETGTPLVDVRKLFEGLSDAGIAGNYLMLDHVHPSIVAHQTIADALCEEVVRQGLAVPQGDWKQARRQRFREHLDSLGPVYFAKGQQRMEILRCWTQGKAGCYNNPSGNVPPGG